MKNVLIRNNYDAGFTLIELSIVILIIGILSLPLFQLYQAHYEHKKILVTRERVLQASNAVGVVALRYPCPSDRSLPTTDANYGIEKCSLAAIPPCTNAGLQGICKVDSLRDADNDSAMDTVVIGGIPLKYYESYDAAGVPDTTSIASLPTINYTNRLDAWNNQLTYAVSASLMNPNKSGTFSDYKLGVISAVNEYGEPTAGVNDDGQYVVVSHGPDGAGAFNANGISTPCTAAGVVQTENCNEDSVFVSAIGASEGTGATYYDDYAYFYSLAAGDIWYNIANSNTGGTTPHIMHRNTGNIGIDKTPTRKLDVNGILRADTIRADRICGSAFWGACLDPTFFSGPPSSYSGTPSATQGVCDPGQVIVEISNQQIFCGYPTFNGPNTGAAKNVNCPAGKFVREIKTNGCIVCNDGSEQC